MCVGISLPFSATSQGMSWNILERMRRNTQKESTNREILNRGARN
jgi:hypothetical protein